MSEQGAPASAPARPLYERIEQIRIERGLTKVQMAELLGVARGTIDNWKTNKRPPAARTVKDVAQRAGIAHSDALRLAGIQTGVADALPESQRPLTVVTDHVADDREYPAIVGDDPLLRHIWDGPGPEVAREWAIMGVRMWYEKVGLLPPSDGSQDEQNARGTA